MLLAVYLLTLGTSAGIVGLFFRLLLGDLGYVSGFDTGMMVAGGAASAYVASQLLFMTTVRFVWPTRTHAPLVADSLSHLASALLLPPLMNVEIAWPHPALYKVELLLFLGSFVAAHTLLKLFSFYSVLHSKPGPRLGSAFWLAATALFVLCAWLPFRSWLASLEASRPRAPDLLEVVQSGEARAEARMLPEGSVLETEVSLLEDDGLTLRWANDPNLSPEERLPGFFVTLLLHGETTEEHSEWVPLLETGWSTMQVPPDLLPKGLRSCSVIWYQEEEPKWRSALGLRPVRPSDLSLLLSGPFAHQQGATSEKPNFVILVVDGLGTDRVSGLGYPRETTSSLDRFAESAIIFPNIYSSAPEAAASTMTLLTGLGPLRHGFLARHQGPLPDKYKTLAEVLRDEHYATGAFTEGGARNDLAFGKGFERGFETFDDVYDPEGPEPEPGDEETQDPEPPAEGSGATLTRALHWITANRSTRYLVFVRLSELRDMMPRERYGNTFLTRAGDTPDPVDVYDSGLAYLDRHLGAFLREVRDTDGEDTCVVITSTHGADFSPPAKLTESVLRIPLYVAADGLAPAVRLNLAALEDVAPALAEMAGTSLGPDTRGSGLLTNPTGVEPISMAGNPLVITIRNDRWRLYWSLQRSPFSATATGKAAQVTLYDLSKFRGGQTVSDESSRYPDIVEKWINRLDRYVTVQSRDWVDQTAATR